MMKKSEWTVEKMLLVISTLAFLGVSIFAWNQNAILEANEDGLTQIETIATTIQRVSKVELESNPNDPLIASVDAMCKELYSAETITCFAENEEILALVQDICTNWGTLKEVVMRYRVTADRNTLFLASEENYNASEMAVVLIKEYNAEYVKKVHLSRNILIGIAIFIGVFLIKLFFLTNKELKNTKEISKEMYLDAATGIYNRAKCQEIMKTMPSETEKERAVIIFDLNDLKKTNDNLGHRAGDQLIYDFAQQIKKATNSFDHEIFVGRYGGDEFMAFLDGVEEQDVTQYIDEVYRILQNFNETQGRQYALSCAAGYGITTKENRLLTVRELFDIADEDMYKNKMAMKEKKKQELLALGLGADVQIDDRL